VAEATSGMTPLAVTGGAVIAVGVMTGLLLWWLFGVGHRRMRRILRGPQVTAQVVGVVVHEGEEDPIYGGGGGGFAPVVSFRSAGGEPVTASGQYALAGSRHRVPAVGTTVQVRYDPRDPRQVYIRGWDAGARALSASLAIGPLLVFLGALMVVSAFVVG
jgi:Protein of unknown function (DUF3592)/Mu transposase, C-terminal